MNIKVFPTGIFQVNTLIIPIVQDKVLVVDPANCRFTRDEDDILDFLDENGLKPLGIVLTHGHFDHIAGLSAFSKKYPNIPIAIHRADSEMIGFNSGKSHAYTLSMMGIERFLPSVSELPEATGFLEDGKTLDESFSSISDESVKSSLKNWKVIHTPGHTKGSVCLYNSTEKVLVSGDTMFYHSWGRTDLGGSEVEIQKSLRRIHELASADTLVYPGHDYTEFPLSENL